MMIALWKNFFSFFYQLRGTCHLGILLLALIFSTSACGASTAQVHNDLSFKNNHQKNSSQGKSFEEEFYTPESSHIRDSPVVRYDIHPDWDKLVTRLKKDLPQAPVEEYFSNLKAYSGRPMAVKVEELYWIKYLRAPRDPSKPKAPMTGIYKNVVTRANIDRCNSFLLEHKKAFDLAEKKYGVSRNILAGLLFVETRLGNYLGRSEAFWSLASMAAATESHKVKDHVKYSIKPTQEEWLQSTLDERTEWAYKELKALVEHCTINEADPQGMPGSVYGAIGICQFMPSNLAHYTDDGDGDGVIDLFNPADAIVSAARYLHKHGWNSQGSVEDHRKTLRRYNNSTRYANTILTMADSIDKGRVFSTPPDRR